MDGKLGCMPARLATSPLPETFGPLDSPPVPSSQTNGPFNHPPTPLFLIRTTTLVTHPSFSYPWNNRLSWQPTHPFFLTDGLQKPRQPPNSLAAGHPQLPACPFPPE
ncbi:hypothetical protein HN51_016760 [Arachis hypogaea]